MSQQPIDYSDLFNGLGPGAAELLDFTKSVQALNRDYSKFAKNLEGDAAKVAANITVVLSAVQSLRTQAADINSSSKAQRAGIDELALAVAKLGKEQLALKQQQAGLAKLQQDTQAATKGTTSALREQQSALKAAFAAGDIDGAKKAALAIITLKAETDNLTRALRGANSDFTAAQGSFRAMENEARKLDVQLKALAGGMDADSTEAQQLKARLAEVNERMRVFTQETGRGYLNVGRYAESLRDSVAKLTKQKTELEANATALRNQARAAGLSAEQQDRLQQEIQQTDAALSKVNAGLRSYGVGLQAGGGLTSGLTGNLGGLVQSLAGAYYGIQGVATALQQGFESNLEYSTSLASVRKTTDLTADEAEHLADKLKELGSPTTLSGLLTIAEVGGQMGIAKDDIYAFTEAVDVAVQALGNDFGEGANAAEEIATILGKISNVYQKELGKDLSQNLLAIGSALNEVSASGAATAPFLADVTKRVGQMSAAYGVGLKNVIAFSATLESQGSTAEVAGTSLNRLFSTIAGKTKASFEIAKLGDTNLTLKQFIKLVNTDFNTAIMAFLRGLNAGGTSTTKVNALLGTLKLQSGEAKNTILALAQNLEMFGKYQGIASDQLQNATSLQKEAAIQAGTLASNWAKLKNNIVATVTNGQVGGFLNTMVRGFNNLIGDLGKFNKVSQDTTAATLASGVANQATARTAQQLLDRYKQLTADGVEPTKKSKQELDSITRQLGVSLGESVVSLNAETGALQLNEQAARDAIKQKLLLSNQAVSTLMLEADKLREVQQKENERVNKLDEQIAKKEKLNNLTSEEAARRVNAFVNETADGKMDKSIIQAEELNKLNINRDASLRKLINTTNDYNEKLRALNKLGAKETYLGLQNPALDSPKAPKKSGEDELESEKKKVADLAAEYYKLSKQRLEARRDDLDRQAENPANTDALRTTALQQAAQVRIELAALEQREGARLAAKSNEDKINGDAATNLERIRLAEKYQLDKTAIGVKEGKEEVALRNATAAALAAVDRLILETEIDTLDDIAADENRSAQERQQAAYDASARRIEIILNESAIKRAAAKGDLRELAKIQEEENKLVAAALRGPRANNADFANNDTDKKYQQSQLALEKNRAMGLFTEKQYQRELLRLEDAYLQEKLKNLEQDATKQKEAAELKVQLAKRTNDRTIEDDKRTLRERVALIEQGLQFVGQMNDAFAAAQYNRLQNDVALNEARYQAESKAAGDNAALKEQAEVAYRKRKYELDQKQFKYDQRAALFNIALSTAQAVARSLADYGFTPAGLLAAAGAGAIGVAQAAAVLSRQPPLPQYFKGRDGGPAEWAHVAERGPELIEGSSGGVRLVEKPSITYLQQGDKVLTADETARRLLDYTPMLHDQQFAARQEWQRTLQYAATVQRDNQRHHNALLAPKNGVTREDIQQLSDQFRHHLEQTLGKMEHWEITPEGLRSYTEYQGQRTIYLNARRRR